MIEGTCDPDPLETRIYIRPHTTIYVYDDGYIFALLPVDIRADASIYVRAGALGAGDGRELTLPTGDRSELGPRPCLGPRH